MIAQIIIIYLPFCSLLDSVIIQNQEVLSQKVSSFQAIFDNIKVQGSFISHYLHNMNIDSKVLQEIITR